VTPTSHADLAREAGVPPWKLRTIREQVRGWDERGLATAIVAVAQADADVKGAASDPAFSLERMVLAVTSARSR
jgi:DNA polymerase-3 subunit delta